MRTCLIVVYWCCCIQIGVAQSHTDPFLDSLIRRHAGQQLQHILQYPDSFRYQLIYTRIDRDRHNRPHFRHYYLNVNPDSYFNPASTVKMPVAFLALEKLNDLHIPGLDKHTIMLTDSAYSGQITVHRDTTAPNGLPSIAQYIRQVFLVSDNDAYNRLYEFIGQQTLHEKLWKKGYPNVRIIRRFMPLSEEENRHTNPIRFVTTTGQRVYQQPPATSTLQYDFSRRVSIGNAYLDKHDQLIAAPMDFTRHNNCSLIDLQRMLQSVLFPASVPPGRRFHLTLADYRFLYQYLSGYPSESIHPRYDTAEYFDSYTKFFLFKAGKSKIPPNIRIFNKTGWSYGFLTDVAYIVDFEHQVEFMLTGTIYVNSDGVLNDNKYEYDEQGYPFFKEIGDIIYSYERQRPRPYKPNLETFRLQYEPLAE